MMMNAGALHPNIGGDLTKAEAAKPANLHAAFGCIHYCCLGVAHQIHS
jgi:hypothetical protein